MDKLKTLFMIFLRWAQGYSPDVLKRSRFKKGFFKRINYVFTLAISFDLFINQTEKCKCIYELLFVVHTDTLISMTRGHNKWQCHFLKIHLSALPKSPKSANQTSHQNQIIGFYPFSPNCRFYPWFILP